MKKILVFNAGSDTLKYKLFAIDQNKNLQFIKKGIVEQIGTHGGPKNHTLALSLLFKGFGEKFAALGNIEDLVAIGHRVVHGGHKYKQVTLINKQVVKDLKQFCSLAPLHNPQIIQVMESVIAQSGKHGHRQIPNYAVFDTAFYHDLPMHVQVYPLPYAYFRDYGIRKFGFHGISHENALEQAIESGIISNNKHNVISVHLGAGSSITAVKDKKPIDTSMGYTPLEGLMMATRPGDFDAGIIHWLIEKKIIKHRDVDIVLNKKSGLLGVSEISNNLADILYIAGYPVDDINYKPSKQLDYLGEHDRNRAKLAIQMYVYKIQKYIGSYCAILGNIDALLFTGTVSERSPFIRNSIMEGIEHVLSKAKIAVIPTEEEMQIAKEILKFV